MKIGIFGGTFDPIHNAHLIIAQYAREEFALDRLLFVPCGNPPHKKAQTDKQIRFEMTKIAIGAEFEISDYEVAREEYSYSLSTIKYFKKQYPDDDIFFIIGEDSLSDIGKWHKPQELLKLCKLIVFPRSNKDKLDEEIQSCNQIFGGNICAISAPVFAISSTEIRERLANGKSVKYMVPEKVMEYIKNNEIYRKTN